jgi:hypothetical protein
MQAKNTHETASVALAQLDTPDRTGMSHHQEVVSMSTFSKREVLFCSLKRYGEAYYRHLPTRTPLNSLPAATRIGELIVGHLRGKELHHAEAMPQLPEEQLLRERKENADGSQQTMPQSTQGPPNELQHFCYDEA